MSVTPEDRMKAAAVALHELSQDSGGVTTPQMIQAVAPIVRGEWDKHAFVQDAVASRKVLGETA